MPGHRRKERKRRFRTEELEQGRLVEHGTDKADSADTVAEGSVGCRVKISMR